MKSKVVFCRCPGLFHLQEDVEEDPLGWFGERVLFRSQA